MVAMLFPPPPEKPQLCDDCKRVIGDGGEFAIINDGGNVIVYCGECADKNNWGAA